MIRNIRKLLGYPILTKDYYKFKDVNKTLGIKKNLIEKLYVNQKENKVCNYFLNNFFFLF